MPIENEIRHLLQHLLVKFLLFTENVEDRRLHLVPDSVRICDHRPANDSEPVQSHVRDQIRWGNAMQWNLDP